jgi:hypothetical protein
VSRAAPRIAIALLGSLLAGAASAHHSPAAFDQTKEIRIEGKLTKYAYNNPHTYLTVQTVGPDGAPVSQEVEAGPISTMQPLGLTRDALTVGEHVVVRANPSRLGAGRTVLGLDVTRADGKVFPLFIQSASVRPASTPLAASIAGTWLPTARDFRALNLAIPTWPLTDEGRRALTAARQGNSTPQSECVPAGAPQLMVYPVALTVTLDPKTVTFDIDWLEARRVVHLDATAHPVNLEPSLQGHSIGHWESDTLVVDTVGFAPHTEGIGFGMPSSERKHIVERFKLDADRRHLDYEITIDDPKYLTESARHTARWEYAPDLESSGVPCDVEIARRYLHD